MKPLIRLTLLVTALAVGLPLHAAEQPKVVRLAKVKVPWMGLQPMDAEHLWIELPKSVQNSQIYGEFLPGRPEDAPGREVRFEVEEAGIVFVVATWTYDGNTGGGWKPSSSSAEQLVAQGWIRLASAIHLSGGKRKDEYVIFARTFDQGDAVKFHTRKYGPPFVIMPTAKEATALLREALGPNAPVVWDGAVDVEFSVTPQRRPIPSDEAQQAARRVVEEVYQAEFAERGSTARASLANTLIQEAARETTDPEHQYVLLRIAGELYSGLGDAVGAATAAQALATAFEVSGSEVSLELLTEAKRHASTLERSRVLAEQCLLALRQTPLPEELEAAEKLADLAESAASRSRQPALRDQSRNEVKRIRGFRAEYTRVGPALETLAEHPDDPEANAAVGQFRCFWQSDWETGLAMLRQGPDSALRSLAEADLSGSDAVSIGDRWWQQSEHEEGQVQLAMRQRAVHWYKEALPTTTGLARSLLEKRISETQPAE